MNGKSLGRSKNSRALSTRVENINSQLRKLREETNPIPTIKGTNIKKVKGALSVKVTRSVTERFVLESSFGSLSLSDMGLPTVSLGSTTQREAIPDSITIRSSPLQYLKVKFYPSFDSSTGITPPQNNQTVMVPARVTPAVVTVNIPDLIAANILATDKILDITSGGAVFVTLTYYDIVQSLTTVAIVSVPIGVGALGVGFCVRVK